MLLVVYIIYLIIVLTIHHAKTDQHDHQTMSI